MHGLRDALEQSQRDGVAIGHFNVGDWVLLKAVLTCGRELKVPVVVGVSEGEREFIGLRQIAALVRSFREESDSPISNPRSHPAKKSPRSACPHCHQKCLPTGHIFALGCRSRLAEMSKKAAKYRIDLVACRYL